MTGFRSRHLRHKCPVNGCFIEALPSWDPLLDEAALPRGIRPMDVDGFIEIGGHFIFLEQKGVGVELRKGGQGYALRALARLPRVTVVLFRPADESGDAWDVLWDETGGPTALVRATTVQLAARLHRWAIDAEAQRAA